MVNRYPLFILFSLLTDISEAGRVGGLGRVCESLNRVGGLGRVGELDRVGGLGNEFTRQVRWAR